LSDSAIDLHQDYLNHQQNEMIQLKKDVQQFYNDLGWQKEDETGLYKDTSLFTDRRPISHDYFHKCHLRLNKYLDHGGEYLLDIASGAIPHSEYLGYSDNYDFRICVDFSLLALKEAKSKLREKGIYILADITNIPISSNVIDSVISLHTVYHVPKEEQGKACSELYRVLKPNGCALIVYTWNNSLLMNLGFLPIRAIRKLKNITKPFLNLLNFQKINKESVEVKSSNTEEENFNLYFNPQNYQWFESDVESLCDNVELRVWSSISTYFVITYIHERFFGSQILGLIYFLEDLFPRLLGRFGQYPIFLIKK
jgi:ubiquinone/menaquinone biosynthesis C-methylase UbiE